MGKQGKRENRPPDELSFEAFRNAMTNRFLVWEVSSIFLAIWVVMVVCLLLLAVAGAKVKGLAGSLAAVTAGCGAMSLFAVLMGGVFKRRVRYRYLLNAFGAQSDEEPQGFQARGPLSGVLASHSQEAGLQSSPTRSLISGGAKKRHRVLQWSQVQKVRVYPDDLTINLFAKRWPFQPLRVFCQSRQDFTAALAFVKWRRPTAEYIVGASSGK